MNITKMMGSGKKLLVLDVNGLLLDSYFQSELQPDRQHDAKVNRFYVYKRPLCDDFIQFCFKNFIVGIWSSAREHNVRSLVEYVFAGTKEKLAFIWHQEHCTNTGFKHPDNKHKPVFLKELSRLWEKFEPDLPWKSGEYGPSNTLLIDDSAYKAMNNPVHTAIFPRTYKATDLDDNYLGVELRSYLEGLLVSRDVQAYLEKNPIGQPSIAVGDPVWSEIFKVVILKNDTKLSVLAEEVGITLPGVPDPILTVEQPTTLGKFTLQNCGRAEIPQGALKDIEWRYSDLATSGNGGQESRKSGKRRRAIDFSESDADLHQSKYSYVKTGCEQWGMVRNADYPLQEESSRMPILNENVYRGGGKINDSYEGYQVCESNVAHWLAEQDRRSDFRPEGARDHDVTTRQGENKRKRHQDGPRQLRNRASRATNDKEDCVIPEREQVRPNEGEGPCSPYHSPLLRPQHRKEEIHSRSKITAGRDSERYSDRGRQRNTDRSEGSQSSRGRCGERDRYKGSSGITHNGDYEYDGNFSRSKSWGDRDAERNSDRGNQGKGDRSENSQSSRGRGGERDRGKGYSRITHKRDYDHDRNLSGSKIRVVRDSERHSDKVHHRKRDRCEDPESSNCRGGEKVRGSRDSERHSDGVHLRKWDRSENSQSSRGKGGEREHGKHSGRSLPKHDHEIDGSRRRRSKKSRHNSADL